MLLHCGSRAIRRQRSLYQHLGRMFESRSRTGVAAGFHSTRRMQVLKPVVLADIGEGIVECEIIQWFVEPEAHVEEFSPLCEVQSDKASVEITSRFSGVVKKLHYEEGQMAKVGKPFVDIDTDGPVSKEGSPASTPPAAPLAQTKEPESPKKASTSETKQPTPVEALRRRDDNNKQPPKPKPSGRFASLATPAVRHVSKELDVDITQIQGTGKDGRVLKEDVYKFVDRRDAASTASPSLGAQSPGPPTRAAAPAETTVELTNVQAQMFKAMTRSLSIPHFLYADEIDFSQMYAIRQRLNKVLASWPTESEVGKLSYMPLIIKAVSLALYQYPVLNARVDLGGAKASLVLRGQHNIGVAMDTPSGLVVPVIRDVGSRHLLSIASELARLQAAGTAGKLTMQDLSGGTITVSNIGNIGGTYLSPLIVDKEVAILGVGRIRTVPAFDDQDRVVKKQVCNFSWSADHRVVDGATMARAAEVVRRIVEEPDVMMMHLR